MGAALDVATQFFDRFAAGDLEGADALFADDCRFTMPMGPMTKAEHRGMGEAFKAGLPDSHMVVDNAIDGGDQVFLEGRFVGTHEGDLQSPDGTIPSSGNKLDLRFADYFKVADGRIVEHRTYFDQVDMLRQLGAMG